MKRAFEALQYETFPDQTAVSHGWVVGYLYRHSDADIYQKDLEKTFHMAPSSITAMVKSLEKSGLIRREPVEKDARLKRIVLTEEGVTFQERTMENFDRLEAAAVEGIPPEDVEKFFAVLIQANQNIKKFNKEAKVADNI
jgi:DNA-binding MarR family transcriptional regulator